MNTTQQNECKGNDDCGCLLIILFLMLWSCCSKLDRLEHQKSIVPPVEVENHDVHDTNDVHDTHDAHDAK